MILIRGLLDRIILLLGVVVGGCVPSLVNQYHQRVGGRLEQVQQDLAPFRQIADRYHGGSMDALIQHHLDSSDPTFYEEGRAIQAMVDSAARLKEMLQALDADIAHQLMYLALHHDAGIMRSTLQVYEPAFVINMEGLMVAAAAGLFAWMVFLGLWQVCSMLTRKAAAWVHPGSMHR